jgi:hypothetical protein
MGHPLLVRLLLAAFLVAAVAPAARATDGAEPMTLEIGKSREWAAGFAPAQVVCDDTDVVRVEDAGKAFKLTGLKAGKTHCSFWSMALPGVRRTLEITVQ